MARRVTRTSVAVTLGAGKILMLRAAVLAAIPLLLASPPDLSAAEYAVGLQVRHFEDQARQNWTGDAARPLATYVWYPAEDGVTMSEIAIPPGNPLFVGGLAARDAPMRNGLGKRPLIVMSHGTGGAGMQMMWLGRALAARGFIAAAVDHHGNTRAEPSFDPRGFMLVWERATDISRVIDRLLADPVFGPVIDPAQIGAAGFSLGGYTVIALAGGRIDVAQFTAFCASPRRDATCAPQPEFPEARARFDALRLTDPRVDQSLSRSGQSFRDPRISSIVALAPALGGAFTAAGLQAIESPVLIVVGAADRTAPPATNAETIAAAIPGAKLHILDGDVDHYVFLNTCNAAGHRLVPVCTDAAGVDRDAIHQSVVELVAAHFAATLAAMPAK